MVESSGACESQPPQDKRLSTHLLSLSLCLHGSHSSVVTPPLELLHPVPAFHPNPLRRDEKPALIQITFCKYSPMQGHHGGKKSLSVYVRVSQTPKERERQKKNSRPVAAELEVLAH